MKCFNYESGISVSICLIFFSQVVHVALMGWLCYALILHAPRDKFHVLVFVFSMGYLCIMHLYRQYYDYGGYSLDITGFAQYPQLQLFQISLFTSCMIMEVEIYSNYPISGKFEFEPRTYDTLLI